MGTIETVIEIANYAGLVWLVYIWTQGIKWLGEEGQSKIEEFSKNTMLPSMVLSITLLYLLLIIRQPPKDTVETYTYLIGMIPAVSPYLLVKWVK